MSDIAIQVKDLGKEYRIGGRQERYRTFRDTLSDAVAGPFRRAANLLHGQAYGAAGLNEMIWALKDVSFEVKYGEVIGIIGRNGAGKSTLLKILSRITDPSTGSVDIYGRVGSLLEVGTGFHPELTGRENIYLNGAILGMTRDEIDRKFDEIVAFAEVERFIDTPVKHYSSGMGLRLGFAVAAHLEPEILVVDEVLAVGDAQFQKRCLGKMSDVASAGRTVLFVSHNMSAVQYLCGRSIWLDEGRIVGEGKTDQIVADYLHGAISGSSDQLHEDIENAPGNEYIRVRRVRVISDTDDPDQPVTMATPLRLEFEYWTLKPDLYLNLSLHIYTAEGVIAFSTAPVHEETWFARPYPLGLFRSVCYIPGYLLNSNTYRVTVMFVEDQARILYHLGDALVFDVAEAPETRGKATWFGKWPGVLHPKTIWETEQVSLEQVGS